FIEGCAENGKQIKDSHRISINNHVKRAPSYDVSSIEAWSDTTVLFPCIFKANAATKETRRSVLLKAPLTLKTTMTLPVDALFEFYFGFVPNWAPVFPAAIELKIRDLKGALVLQKSIGISDCDAGEWQFDQTLLHKIHRQEIQLELSIQSIMEEPFYIILGEPVVRPEADRKNVSKPNIIIVSLDTFRGDHMTSSGYREKTTPTLDRIAREGVLFTRAYSQSGLTLPSHKSILSGYYPQLFAYFSDSPNVRQKRLTPEIPLFPTHLKKIGYYNVAFTGGGFLSAAYGFYREFDLYNQLSISWHAAKNPLINQRPIKQAGFESALSWLKQNGSHGPFFMFLHTFALHYPYVPPPKYDQYFQSNHPTEVGPYVSMDLLKEINSKKLIPSQDDQSQIVAVYDRGIRWIDDEMLRLYECLSNLDILEDTILIVLSDHGEEFLEHGLIQHKMMYSTCLHVPLIIRAPKFFPQNVVVREEVELIQLMPTLCELLHVSPSILLQGRSLLAMISDLPGTQPHRFRFGSQNGWITTRYEEYEFHSPASQSEIPIYHV
ncbi:sulfatase, partial [candidate division CSSED10-310 bacterium]